MEGTVSMLPADPTLPLPWKGLVDNETGYIFFWNPETNTTQWKKPLPLVGSGRPRESKGKRRRRKRKSVVVPNGIHQVNGVSGISHNMANLNVNHACAVEAMLNEESKLATVSISQEAQVVDTISTTSESKLFMDGVDSTDSDGFTKALEITGADGCLGIRGEYHLKADLYDGFPRYEKIGVDPKKLKERRFLTHFNVGPGHWVFSDWDEFLLLGPVADRQADRKSPDKYEGTYEVRRGARWRCKGGVMIKIVPVKHASNVAISSSSERPPSQSPSDVATSSSSTHQFPTQTRAKNLSSVAAASSSIKQSPTQAQNHKRGPKVDEDARAVRKRFHKQKNDAIQNGTCEELDDSDEDILSEFLPWSSQPKLCEHCGKKGKFKCKRCNFTYYCSEAHQAAHHAKHQRVCDQLEGVKFTRSMENMLRWVGPPDSDAEDGDDDDIDPFDDDMIMSTFGMSAFEFRTLDGSRYTDDQRYQGSYEDAMNAIDFCPDADDPRFWW